MTESIGKEFWETEHKKNSGWLTGTTFDMLSQQYNFTPATFHHRSCLEIGVGRGIITQHLAGLASTLYCCDISETALNQVKKWATLTYLSQELDQVPPVDIAVCHLVLVHCDDSECERILGSIKLAEQGKIFCQFCIFENPAVGIDNAQPYVKDMLSPGKNHFFRTNKQILDIIESAGLVVENVWTKHPGDYFGWTNQLWNYYELRK
jgi:hypothetical protein